MNRNEVIEQGLIEQYVLGELADSQKDELESLISEDQELTQYLQQIEEGLEKLAKENAVTPPPAVKTLLLENVLNQKSDKDNVHQLNNIKRKNKRNWPLGIAASISLLFMISSLWLYYNWQQSQGELNALKNDVDQLNRQLAEINNKIDETNKWYQAINEPNTTRLLLNGNQLSPSSKAITYINHERKEVIVNAKGLSELSINQTYQMWADVEGVMINMGIIPANTEMIALKYIENAESVNLTIEPAGGSDHPTVEKLIANAYL